jgi:hypothetical protein
MFIHAKVLTSSVLLSLLLSQGHALPPSHHHSHAFKKRGMDPMVASSLVEAGSGLISSILGTVTSQSQAQQAQLEYPTVQRAPEEKYVPKHKKRKKGLKDWGRKIKEKPKKQKQETNTAEKTDKTSSQRN